jgi:peptide/nickel transport system substrate-binding protein
MLKANWKTIGADVNIQSAEVAVLIKDVIRPRNYEVLLFGQDLGGNSDPYVYWHSSQIKDPGLALAVEVDKDIDNNLEQARISLDLNHAITYFIRFQNAFADLVPAVLLYQPRYVYLVDDKLKGIDEHINLSYFSDRFANIDKWYIKTKKQ